MMKRESYTDNLIVCRGGGDIATGIIHRLFKAGFPVLILECDQPSSIRRAVSFSEAVYQGAATVEGVTAVRINNLRDIPEVLLQNKVPLYVDAEATCIETLNPAILIDAIIAKRNLGTSRKMAPFVIGVGPGFTASEDVDVVIETMRGHNLGRVITSGSAMANTGIPGEIAGYTSQRVIHAEKAGVISHTSQIGDMVTKGQEIAKINAEGKSHIVTATIDGILKGLIRESYEVSRGLKIADIDPRADERENCFTISDKARCISGGVLEAVCTWMNGGMNNA